MKILLLQNVKGLGKAGDVREVADGYARNYLIPRGMAVPATPSNLRKAEHQKRIEEEKMKRLAEDAQALAEAISNLTLTFRVKAGEKDKLFGSITNADIALALERELGRPFNKHKIELEEPIKQLGMYNVPIKLMPGLVSEVRVVVEREG
ncbi:MAG: 50S ribosomal protein L9 [Chloroflexi bacterium]|nr:MAG: 50S ribosomal protein L9 [Chloroflexota bacterium]